MSLALSVWALANDICTTTSSELVNRDEVVLYGPDLKAIKKDVPFARIVLLRVGVLDGEDEEVYRALKRTSRVLQVPRLS